MNVTYEQASALAQAKSMTLPGAVFRVAKLRTGEWYVYRGLPGVPASPHAPITAFVDGKEVHGRHPYRGSER